MINRSDGCRRCLTFIRRQWERRNGIVEVPKEKKNTKKKTKSKDHSDEETSSSEEEEMDGPSKRKLEKKSTDGRNEKKRRVAIDHALLKMKESGLTCLLYLLDIKSS